MTADQTDRSVLSHLRGFAVVVILLFGIYISGYVLAQAEFQNGSHEKLRIYNSSTLARLFIPAAWVEARVIGRPVLLVGRDSSPHSKSYSIVYATYPD